jgi:hypothetical protein
MRAFLQSLRSKRRFPEAMEITWTPTGVRINDQKCSTTLKELQSVLRKLAR